MKSKMKLSGQLRSYLRWPLILSILMLVMNIGMYFVDVMAGMWFTLFFAVYVIAAAVLYYRQDVCAKGVDLNKVRTHLGMVFQQFNLFPHLSVKKNVMLAQQKVLKRSKEEAEKIAVEELTKVGLAERIDFMPSQLSGGQQQRVAIARALSMNPHVMLFDEATSALDPELVRDVLGVMRDLARDGMTMIVVTHEMGFARRAANNILFMEDGEIIDRASTGDFFTGHVSERAQRFLTQILH